MTPDGAAATADLPSGWTSAPAITLLEKTVGGTWGRAPGTSDVDALVIRVADFRDSGDVDFAAVPTRAVTQTQFDSRRLRVGDILLEKSGGGPTKPVGRAVRINNLPSDALPTNFVQLLRPNPAIVEPSYLFWWLWWSHLNGKAAEHQRATTNIRNLQTHDYLTLEAPLPPLAEQRRIVAALEEQLSRLDAADRWLTKAWNRTEALEAAVYGLAVQGSWPTQSLSDIAVTASGGTPSRRRREYFGGAIPWVKSGELRDGTVSATEETITDLGLRESSAKVFPAGTLLIALYGATVGKLGVLEIDAATNQAVCAIMPKDTSFAPYLRLVLRSKRRFLLTAARGGAQPNISQAILQRLDIPVPPAQERDEIVFAVEQSLVRLREVREQFDVSRRKGRALRKALLAAAFCGKLTRQDPAEEPAVILFERIAAQRAGAQIEVRKRQRRTPA